MQFLHCSSGLYRQWVRIDLKNLLAVGQFLLAALDIIRKDLPELLSNNIDVASVLNSGVVRAVIITVIETYQPNLIERLKRIRDAMYIGFKLFGANFLL